MIGGLYFVFFHHMYIYIYIYICARVSRGDWKGLRASGKNVTGRDLKTRKILRFFHLSEGVVAYGITVSAGMAHEVHQVH